MSVSAIERAPVEVWSNILGLAIRSPLIPHPDATLALSISLFSSGCVYERHTRELAQITGRLRQVCRSWDILVQRLQPAVVQCNFDNACVEYVPPNVIPYPFEKNQTGEDTIRCELLKAQRLQAWGPFECVCGRQCCSSLPGNVIQAINWKHMKHWMHVSKDLPSYLIPPQNLTRVEVLVISGYGGAEWPSNLFELLPRLKALAWWSDWCRSFFDAAIQHSFHERLTHLKVQLHWADLYDRQSPLFFRLLHVLHLTVVNGVHCDAKPGHLDLATWAVFPALHSLHLAVSVTYAVSKAETDRETGRKRGEVSSLLNKVGSTLDGLLLDLPEEWEAWFTPDMWTFFPSLLEFGYKTHFPTTDHPPPPEGMCPLNILYQFAVYAPKPVRTSSGQTIFDNFIEMCQKWRTRRITMFQTWKEAERVLASPITEGDRRRLPKRIDFYERFGASGVKICDRDGICVTEPPGARFLEALKDYEVRLQAWKPSDDDAGRLSRRRRHVVM